MRKQIASVLAGVLLMSSLAIPASATAPEATENFHVYINGGSKVSSKLAQKSSAAGLPMWAWVTKMAGSSINWLPSENVNIRGRSPSGTYATEVEQTNDPHAGKISLHYLSGFGQAGSLYKMAVQYDNNNPYTHLELTVTWSP